MSAPFSLPQLTPQPQPSTHKRLPSSSSSSADFQRTLHNAGLDAGPSRRQPSPSPRAKPDNDAGLTAEPESADGSRRRQRPSKGQRDGDNVVAHAEAGVVDKSDRVAAAAVLGIDLSPQHGLQLAQKKVVDDGTDGALQLGDDVAAEGPGGKRSTALPAFQADVVDVQKNAMDAAVPHGPKDGRDKQVADDGGLEGAHAKSESTPAAALKGEGMSTPTPQATSTPAPVRGVALPESLMEQVIRDTHLRLSVEKTAARLSVAMSDGSELALKLSVKEGGVDVKLAGDASSLVMAKGAELKAALAAEGLDLRSLAQASDASDVAADGEHGDKSLDASQQDSERSRRDRDVDDDNGTRVATSEADDENSSSVDDPGGSNVNRLTPTAGRVHVRA